MNETSQKQAGKMQTVLYTGIYVLSMLIFGTNGLLVAHISLQPKQIVLMRTLIGGLLLTGLVLLRGGFDREAVRAEKIPLLLGGAALGFNWVALFEAYRLLNVSLATLIYYVGPMLILLLSPVLFREKLTASKIAAVCLVAVGLVCISGSIAFGGLSAVGLLTAIVSALFYAALIAFNKRIVRTGGMQTAAIELDVAFAVVLVYVLLTSGLPRLQRASPGLLKHRSSPLQPKRGSCPRPQRPRFPPRMRRKRKALPAQARLVFRRPGTVRTPARIPVSTHHTRPPALLVPPG